MLGFHLLGVDVHPLDLLAPEGAFRFAGAVGVKGSQGCNSGQSAEEKHPPAQDASYAYNQQDRARKGDEELTCSLTLRCFSSCSTTPKETLAFGFLFI